MASGPSNSRITKKTDISIQEDKPVFSGHNQISDEKAANNSSYRLRIQRGEAGDQSVQVNRLEGVQVKGAQRKVQLVNRKDWTRLSLVMLNPRLLPMHPTTFTSKSVLLWETRLTTWLRKVPPDH